ncbi:WD repeat-containing protein 87 isoform X2 [Onychostoma macrolepis]|uniref:ADF-H domain-containing protein n=1 Tax=Onychostoma macrolepis TaxID=369639 RepID=A0A7J6BWB9_9TELE|nr:WD repeat-containing protein 87 isoform X2 [Onychostoma macrolepis]KAF4098803.1 hypothetical protein G5714_020833 [Onychostoma macrolepis]
MKSMREVDLDTYSLSLLTAKEDILSPRSSTNWALFTYDGIMNRLKLADSGVGGLKELTAKLHPRRPLYGMCRVGKAQPRIAMILWVGNEVDEYRRAECASHLPAIRSFFKEVHIFLPAHTLDEITEERICTLAYNAAVVTQGPRGRPSRRTEDRQAIVGTNYKRTIAVAEIQRIQRDSFWAQAEREEEERKKEEQRRAAEDRRQREKERLLQERRDAIERERRMNEKEQKIKEQRRIQAQMEAEARKQEKIKWEHEEREHEEDEIRARYSRSQSGEKAAEAAALVSQRTVNPREFFRQLSSSSVHTASSPSSTSPVRSPYRRLHRSQTENIFSFNDSPSSTPTSPYRPSVVSPYFLSNPTSRSPILFTSTTASSLHNGAMVSTKSQIQLSSPKTIEPWLQTQPSPTTSATKSEIKSPISDILDSLVFYPPPPTPEQLKPDESEIVDELPPPPPGFENSPEPSVNQAETLDEPLDPLLPPSCVLVPEPPTRPLPALPVAPRMLKDLEAERDFTARALVISTVEEEEDEGSGEKEMKYERKDATEEEEKKGGGGEVRAETGEKKNRGQEEHDGMTVEKHECEKESTGKSMEKYESGKEQDGKMLEEKQDGNIMEECERVDKIVEEQESEKIRLEGVLEKDQDGKIREKHEEDLKEHENHKNMEEYKQDGNVVEAFDSEKEQDEKNTDVFVTEKIQYRKTMDECEQENEHNGIMVEKCEEEHDSEKEKRGTCMEEYKSKKEQDQRIIEFKSENIQNAKMTLHMREDKQDAKIVDVFDNEKEQDKKSMEVSQTEKTQYARMMEECEKENEQDGKTVEKYEEEHESEKEQDGEIMKEQEVDKIQDMVEKFEEYKNAKEIDGKMMVEHGSREKRDGNIMDAFDSDKEQDETSIEVFETEKLQYVPKMEECGQEKEQDGKTVKNLEEHDFENENIQNGDREEHESEKDEGFKVVEVFETEISEECGQENEQDGKPVEKHEHGKSLADDENENQQNCEMIEEKIHDGDFIEEREGEKEEWKVVEVFETEKIHQVKIMEAREQDGKNVEKCEKEDDGEEQDGRSLEEQDWKIMEMLESEKEQDWKIGEEHEDGKRLEEQEGEKEQDWKMTEKIQYVNISEEHESENKQDEMTENQQDRENQDKERMSHVDVDKAVNVTVLRKEESYTEVLKRDEKEPLIQTEEADTVFSQHAPIFPESHAAEPSAINDACIPQSISTTQDKKEPQMCSTDTASQINLPTIQVESDLSCLNNQGDSDMKEKTEPVDSQASSEISKNTASAEQTPAVEDEQTDAEMLQENKIVDSSSDLAERIDAESKTSHISENQARTGQSDEGEGEGLVPVCHNPEDTVGLKYCITHQLDPTNDISDVEEGEEAISLLASDTDVEQNFKCDSDPDQVNEDIKHAELRNYHGNAQRQEE